MDDKQFAVKLENGKKGVNGSPSVGPIYRNLLAKDKFPPLDSDLKTTWDVFRYFKILVFVTLLLIIIIKVSNAYYYIILKYAGIRLRSIRIITC